MSVRSQLGAVIRRASGSTLAGTLALVFVALIAGVAVFGPLLSPTSPSDIVGAPFMPSSGEHPLGTDFLGRDVLTRLLHGGTTTVLVAVFATIGSTVVGGTVGLVAGYRGGMVDEILMRAVDVLLAFPPILFLLMLASGFGPSAWLLWIAITIIFSPGVARIVRAATQTVSQHGYVEAAAARGESMPRIVFREILPNIRAPLVADAGPRLTFAILLVAAVNYLGLGLRPPAADWALMISENKAGLGLQLWASLAPAILIASLTVAVNVLADQFSSRSSPIAEALSP